MNLKKFHKVSNLVLQERLFQNQKWGEPQVNTLPEWMTILGEEFGESCQEALGIHYASKPSKELVAEIIQVAAVAFAILENLAEEGLLEI